MLRLLRSDNTRVLNAVYGDYSVSMVTRIMCSTVWGNQDLETIAVGIIVHITINLLTHDAAYTGYI